MFQPFSAVRLGNTTETPAFLALVAWLRGPQKFWRDPIK